MLVQWLGISLATSLPISVQAATSEDVAPAAIAPLEIAPADPVVTEAPAPATLPDPVVVESEPHPAAAAAELEAIEAQPAAPNQPEVVSNQTYINPQDFSLSEQPDSPISPDVIISERSSGCQAVLQPGSSVPTSLCQTPPAQTAYTVSPEQNPSVGQSEPTELDRSGYDASAGSYRSASAPYYNSGRNPYISKLYQGSNPLRWLGLNGKNIFFPLAIPAEITSVFGWRLNPVSGLWRMHTGTDLAAPIGTPVLAVQAGEVVTADYMGGYGFSVILAHNQHQQETLYAHLSEMLVNPGQKVKQGEVIGLVGSTGNSTGPHLHFEVLQRTAQGMVPVDAGPKLTVAMNQLQQAIKVARAKSAAN
ncbi:MAG: peptidoglycan DD-metalloendopeptidase family protein [Aphanocapsa sp. GSE-SYN-MK-11-07L]|nr:peptidoglycan DD-metalloendopeptidase family protein [Aphanocapsa sp. GSE-SYN-MK-11-07L]